MSHLFIFGLGYSAKRIAKLATAEGWEVLGTGGDGEVNFDNMVAVRARLKEATHVLSSVPPDRATGKDPVLDRYGDDLQGQWLGYLSSSGVYGDAGGGWVDEDSPMATRQRMSRAKCDAAWLEKGARVFRLPGIYGPGRNAIERVREGKAYRIRTDGVFSRVHVDDLAAGVMSAMLLDAPAGAYNLADDLPCSQSEVVEEACRLLGVEPPPLQTLEEAGLSEMARSFYAENRRVSNAKAKRELRWWLQYPTYKEGLASLL